MTRETTSWRKLLAEEAAMMNDPITVCTISDAELDREFEHSHSGPFGTSFVAWSKLRVYYSGEYDGLDIVESNYRGPEEYLQEASARCSLRRITWRNP